MRSLTPNPPSSASPPARLRALLADDAFLTMPCCFDALSARLIEQAGFPLTFMSGFAVSAARLGLPDTGLITVTEMLDQGRAICQAVALSVIGDGDTGHGNPANVRRTVEQFGLAGFAGVMIEDQLAPKRCGHTGVKEVVGRPAALARIRAAVDARDARAGCPILARTDARSALGLDEANCSPLSSRPCATPWATWLPGAPRRASPISQPYVLCSGSMTTTGCSPPMRTPTARFDPPPGAACHG